MFESVILRSLKIDISYRNFDNAKDDVRTLTPDVKTLTLLYCLNNSYSLNDLFIVFGKV